MKRWYKKVNRGFVLAGILLIGLIIYNVIGAIQFNQQKENAKKTVEDYIQSVIALTESETVSQSQAEELMDRYWKQKEMRLQDGGIDKQEFQAQLNQYLKEKNQNVEQLSGIITEYQISKYGRTGALCQVVCNYDAILKGETAILFPEGLDVIDQSIWKENGLEPDQAGKLNEQIQLYLYLELENDGWKIVRITVEYYGSGMTAV